MRIFVLLALLAGTKAILAAEPELYRGLEENGRAWCEISGPITENTYSRFEKLLLPGCKTLYINSLGGDVATALAMGRLVRKKEMAVVLPRQGKCASACVFIYIGGVIRVPEATLQIHRPYLTGSSLNFVETQQKYHAIERQIKTYLRDMNASEQLYDDMMKIPPQESKHIGIDELDRYGVPMYDPVYLEHIENKHATEAGLSKVEWLRLKSAAERECGNQLRPMTDAVRSVFRDCWRENFVSKLPKIPASMKYWTR